MWLSSGRGRVIVTRERKDDTAPLRFGSQPSAMLSPEVGDTFGWPLVDVER